MLSREERDQLAQSFQQKLFDAIASQTSSPMELVQDACQHAWLQLERSPPASIENVRGWLFTVARHQLYKLSQREQRELSLDALADSTPSGAVSASLPYGTAASPEQLAEQHQDLALLGELPERQQRILLLQAAGFNHAEISERLGITTRTVERQVLRARTNLRALRAARDADAPLPAAADRPPTPPERPPEPDTRQILAAGFPSPPGAAPRAPQPPAERRAPRPPPHPTRRRDR